MTNAMLATATVAGDSGHIDVAVPVGTTVATLLANLQINAADPVLLVTLPDGRPAPLDSTLGEDLPSGTLLAVTSRIPAGRTNAAAADGAHALFATDRLPGLATAALGLILGVGGILMPLVTPWTALGAGPRLLIGALLALSVAALHLSGRINTLPARAVLEPMLMGFAVMSLVDPGAAGATRIALAGGVITAAVASFVSWRFGSHTPSSAAAAWAIAAGTATATAAIGADPAFVGAVTVSMSVTAVILAPSYGTAVPDHQILDLPLVSTSVRDVRAPKPPSPAQITARRIQTTLSSATAITAVLTLAGTLGAVLGSAVLATTINLSHLPGQAAIACLVLAAGALALAPRGSRSPVTQVAPRVGAALIVAVGATAIANTGVIASMAAAGGLALVGLGIVVGTALTNGREHSALLGRAADLIQATCLGLLFPTAFLAANAFLLIWQATT